MKDCTRGYESLSLALALALQTLYLSICAQRLDQVKHYTQIHTHISKIKTQKKNQILSFTTLQYLVAVIELCRV